MKYSTNPRRNAPVPNCTTRLRQVRASPAAERRRRRGSPCGSDATTSRDSRGRAAHLQRDSFLPDRDLAIAVLLVVRELRSRRDGEDIANRSSSSCAIVFVPSSSAPALKSIQCGFFAAISLFDDTLIVGTGKPSGVPRPVVNSSSVAPLTTIAVDDTPSLPGDSSSERPRVAQRLAVAQHARHRRASALLDRAERLLLERRQAAGLVARRRILVDRLVVAEKVCL